MPDDTLPIEPALAPVAKALHDAGLCVLQAPPGAGKTTRVPVYLAEAGISGRILMLEPRRVAARGAALRLAEAFGEEPGGRVGYRMRGDAVPGAKIEVVTEGILTRMLQSDPELSDIGCVIFDEFHERSLQADLGLALCLEVREALRPDLKLLVMSATLDAGPVAALIGDAPIVTSEGRSFGIETRWLDRPASGLSGRGVYEAAVADLVETALAETEGGVLVFLPGRAEINRTAARLSGRLPAGVELMQMHGSLPFRAQQQVLAPLKAGRKLVLSTSIAETSLTVPDIRVVVDGGRARRSRFDPASGMARLVTERVSRAEADQRRGRAGRVAEGWCYRLWTKGEEGGLPAFAPPEIATADLAPLALDLAAWGAEASDLAFLSPPPEGHLATARQLLEDLGALKDGRLTEAGRRMAAVPAHPRLARMLVEGGAEAVPLAALLDGRDLLLPDPARPPSDLSLRLKAMTNAKRFESDHPFRVDRAALDQARQTAKRLTRHAGPPRDLSPGALLSLAYPDRIGLRRDGEAPRYLMSGGSGAVLPDGDPLSASRLLVAANLDGERREARVRLALSADLSELQALHADRLQCVDACHYNRRYRRVDARRQLRLGQLVLEDERWDGATDADIAPALLEAVRDLGLEVLTWSKPATALLTRTEWLRKRGADLPQSDPETLLATLEAWLLPWLPGIRSIDALRQVDIHAALQARLDADQMQTIARLAPTHITAPTGTRLAIDYAADQPGVAVRLQEMFGTTRHPTIGPDHVPLVIDLLSPARRLVQKTADLPAFWDTSYLDVRKDMRGRYPKHPWPENPREAPPTTRTKPRSG
ncbi:ATP-dependent helicase HrpB [Halovulum sp. GXIMD14793]